MPDPALLDESVVRSTMTAMVTLIMGRNEATRSEALNYSMSWKGETLTGTESAEKVLLESLVENTDAWAEYLIKPENRKVAVSMDAAIDADLGERLIKTTEGVRIAVVLDAVNSDAPTFKPEMIDIRTGQPVSALTAK